MVRCVCCLLLRPLLCFGRRRVGDRLFVVRRAFSFFFLFIIFFRFLLFIFLVFSFLVLFFNRQVFLRLPYRYPTAVLVLQEISQCPGRTRILQDTSVVVTPLSIVPRTRFRRTTAERVCFAGEGLENGQILAST